MKKTFSVVMVLVLFISLFFLVGCAKTESNTIKIGGIFPLSGPVAVYGTEAKNGVSLAIDAINADGGIDGKLVELISEDDEGNPEKSVNAYKKLVSKDKVDIIIGSLTSGCTAAITQLAQAQKVLVVAPAATLESITDAGDYIFRTCFIDPFQGTVGGRFAVENLGAKRAAVLYDIGNDYSIGLFDNFKAAFEKGKGEVVAAESYNTGDKDFNAQLTKIKIANPDVVYLPDYYATVALIAKQLRAQGITCPIVGGDGWGGIVANAGEEVLGGYYSDHYASDSTEPNVIEFVKNYKEKYGTDPVSFAALGFDSMNMLRDAIVRVGSSEASAVKEALEATNGSYVTGNLSFDEKHNPIKSAVIVEIVKDGENMKPVYNTTINP
ncbi:MAG: ABC transporter substrate-binding protein [Spirochaetaceae bacterium]|nr:ABC transporter substrate-binding protein [Spirochaetaceae bacterium]